MQSLLNLIRQRIREALRANWSGAWGPAPASLWIASIATGILSATEARAQCNTASNPTTRFVRNGGDDGCSGQSWDEAYEHIEAAIADVNAASSTVNEIHIAGGSPAIYRPSGGTNASFVLIKPCAILGGYTANSSNPDERDVCGNPTILSGDLDNDDGEDEFDDNSWHVVLVQAQTQGVILLDGLTIVGGYALGESTLADRVGGAVLSRGPVWDSEIRVRNCIFEGNKAHSGGAIFSESQLFCRGCRFSFNEVQASGNPGVEGSGGAIASSTRFELTHCRFEFNAATPSGLGGAVSGDHGVIDEEDPDPPPPFLVANCVFVGNSAGNSSTYPAPSFGGAIAVLERTQMVISGSVISGNFANNGGGISQQDPSAPSKVWITSCTIVDNDAINGGGINAHTADIHDSIIVGNTATDSSGLCTGFDLDLCTEVGPNIQSAMQIHYSCVTDHDTETTLGWTNNIEAGASALFINAGSGNFHLKPNSPAIDAGSSALLPKDPNNVDEDSSETETLPWDPDRNARIVGSTTDMGAYEWRTCQADLTGDGMVSGADLTIVLANWGLACEEGPCPGDANLDGYVNAFDITFILANWGPCVPPLGEVFCSEAPGEGGEVEMMSFSGGGCLDPAGLMATWGFEDLSAFAEWLESLDFETMAEILSALEGA